MVKEVIKKDERKEPFVSEKIVISVVDIEETKEKAREIAQEIKKNSRIVKKLNPTK